MTEEKLRNLIYHPVIRCPTRRCGADDIVIAAGNENILKDMYLQLEEEVVDTGLVVICRKTKYMKASAEEE